MPLCVILMKSSLGKRLKEAREGKHLSQTTLGKAINAGQTTVASWEIDKNEPDLLAIRRLAKVLDVSPEWLAFAIKGNDYSHHKELLELNVRAVAGPGGLEDALEGDDDSVRARYYFPSAEFRSAFGVDADRVRVLEVIGDSMLGTLAPGEKVLVDYRDTVASPPGIFVVWDGMGLVLKRVEFIAQSDPPRVRISSDNPRYNPYERTIDEAYIQGRVIGSWQRR